MTEAAPRITERELRKAMVAKIKSEMSVGITNEIKSALEVTTEFQGTTPSQFGRQAILEKLCEGFLKHPMQRHLENSEPAE
jgi:hypothetical protein